MSSLRLGSHCGYSGASMQINRELILEAERLGFWSVWSAEAYGSDAVSPLAYIAAFTTGSSSAPRSCRCRRARRR